jgi:hypothetical protein
LKNGTGRRHFDDVTRALGRCCQQFGAHRLLAVGANVEALQSSSQLTSSKRRESEVINSRRELRDLVGRDQRQHVAIEFIDVGGTVECIDDEQISGW